MIIDANLQVWFDINTHQGQTLVVPYVKAEHAAMLHYELKVRNSGKAGNSMISQDGTVSVSAEQAKAMSSIKVTPNRDGKCEIDLILREDGGQQQRYSANCSEGQ